MFIDKGYVMLQLQSISKKFGKQVIFENVDQNFEPGVTLLVGPSGAGKTTLLRLCATADKPSTGQIVWNGTSVWHHPKNTRRVLGYAPQIVDLPIALTGDEFLQYMAALKGLGKGARKQAWSLANSLNLDTCLHQRIGVYSGGMRRRLVLVQALLGNPELLALDEPTAELDTENANRVAELVTHYAKTAVVLVTTHLTEQFTKMGARTLRVQDARVVEP